MERLARGKTSNCVPMIASLDAERADYGASFSGSSCSSAGRKRRRRRSGFSCIEIPKSLQFALSSLADSSSSLEKQSIV